MCYEVSVVPSNTEFLSKGVEKSSCRTNYTAEVPLPDESKDSTIPIHDDNKDTPSRTDQRTCEHEKIKMLIRECLKEPEFQKIIKKMG